MKFKVAGGILSSDLLRFTPCLYSTSTLNSGLIAMIGAIVGYHYDNPLFGGIAGALFGVLTYEIVSKRLLKLVPVKRIHD